MTLNFRWPWSIKHILTIGLWGLRSTPPRPTGCVRSRTGRGYPRGTLVGRVVWAKSIAIGSLNLNLLRIKVCLTIAWMSFVTLVLQLMHCRICSSIYHHTQLKIIYLWPNEYLFQTQCQKFVQYSRLNTSAINHISSPSLLALTRVKPILVSWHLNQDNRTVHGDSRKKT